MGPHITVKLGRGVAPGIEDQIYVNRDPMTLHITSITRSGWLKTETGLRVAVIGGELDGGQVPRPMTIRYIQNHLTSHRIFIITLTLFAFALAFLLTTRATSIAIRITARVIVLFILILLIFEFPLCLL